MDGIFVLLALLVCPISMGLMMFFMMRGKHGRDQASADDAEQRQGDQTGFFPPR